MKPVTSFIVIRLCCHLITVIKHKDFAFFDLLFQAYCKVMNFNTILPGCSFNTHKHTTDIHSHTCTHTHSHTNTHMPTPTHYPPCITHIKLMLWDKSLLVQGRSLITHTCTCTHTIHTLSYCYGISFGGAGKKSHEGTTALNFQTLEKT